MVCLPGHGTTRKKKGQCRYQHKQAQSMAAGK